MGAYQLEVEHWGLPRVYQALVFHHMTLLVTSLRKDFRIEYKPDSWLKLEIIHPMLNKVMEHLILMKKAYIPNLRPLVPSFHVKKFVVSCGWWVVGV